MKGNGNNMVRIVSTNNKLHLRRKKNCNALVSYEKEDLEYRPLDIIKDMKSIVEDISFINCPNCYEEIIIENIEESQ